MIVTENCAVINLFENYSFPPVLGNQKGLKDITPLLPLKLAVVVAMRCHHWTV